MFTGIVSDMGEITEVRPGGQPGGGPGDRRFVVRTRHDMSPIAIGASISCGGVCLTVTALPDHGSNARWFEVEAWEGDRKIGDGTHRRGIVNVTEFEQRYGVRQLAASLD